MSKKKITAEELEKKFDDGEEDILEHFDVSTATRRVNVDFPLAMLDEIDAEVKRLGIPRQALLKMWIDDRLEIIRERNKTRVG